MFKPQVLVRYFKGFSGLSQVFHKGSCIGEPGLRRKRWCFQSILGLQAWWLEGLGSCCGYPLMFRV